MRKKASTRYRLRNKNIILQHINSNIEIYIAIIIIFAIGICVGVSMVNRLENAQIQSLNDYLSNTINIVKSGASFPKAEILKQSLFKNFCIILVIWIFGLTFFR